MTSFSFTTSYIKNSLWQMLKALSFLLKAFFAKKNNNKTLVFCSTKVHVVFFSPRLIEPYRDPTRLQNWSVFYCFFSLLLFLLGFFLYQFGARNKCLLVVAFKISLYVSLHFVIMPASLFYVYILCFYLAFY